ncbi:MAG: YifB family Mg chelatase-like AAA ATPase [Patescibacteria group bacterium]|nr:YifB family Mg chelatase-like AAA ATPase [Patescibacteria group bacterium]
MSSKVFSAVITGFDAEVVEVEVDTSYGLRCFNIVGLPDKAVDESKHRVATAIKSLKFKAPLNHSIKVLVNLAPADLKKQGSLYDLPIALGYLLDTKQVKFAPQEKIFVGELSLTGELKPIKGALSFAIMAKEKGFEEIILPEQNANEANLIKGLRVIGINSLNQAIRYLEKKEQIAPCATIAKILSEDHNSDVDLKYIKGQHSAKRALEITAAGAHNLLMLGPPGTGKTLLAKALVSILPKLSFEEAVEVTKIYSISGLLPENSSLIYERPFRSPHHSSSEISLIGGGNPPKPGEITLAHRGILFLDEFPEFHRDVLESLRQPIEEGHITILRAKYHLSMPARFTLVAASNPCPCGNYGNPEKVCTCNGSQIQKYKRKLTGPLMDRIDVFIDVPSLNYEKLTDSVEQKHSSADIRKKVETARKIQKQRFEKQNIFVNSEIKPQDIKKYCEVDAKSSALLKKYVDSGKLSARGYHRVLKLARTIADLSCLEKIKFDNVAEALMYRTREN